MLDPIRWPDCRVEFVASLDENALDEHELVTFGGKCLARFPSRFQDRELAGECTFYRV